jgi:ubiquinone/menaquinone biosynthesis C-methylase UbiE
MKTPVSLVVIAVVALVALTFSATQSSRGSVPSEKIFAALELQKGQTVGEIGAGNGDLSIAAARLVGPDGKVLTSELGERNVRRLRQAVDASGLGHITVVEGNPDTTNFPDACCDAIFMRNVYHHFADPAAMNASIARSLKPGGRVAIVDFEPNRGRPEAARPADRANTDSHGTTAASVARELKDAGLDVIHTEPGASRWFMVVARLVRPGVAPLASTARAY